MNHLSVVSKICEDINYPLFWGFLGFFGLLLALIDFLGLTHKIENYIDNSVRKKLEETINALPQRAREYESRMKETSREARRIESLKFDAHHRLTKGIRTIPHLSWRFQLYDEYEYRARFNAIKQNIINDLVRNSVRDAESITDEEIIGYAVPILEVQDYHTLRSASEQITSILALVCLVLTFVTWSPVMLFFLIGVVIYFLFRGLFYVLYFTFIYFLSGAFFLLLRVIFTCIMYVTVIPTIAFLRLIDKPPSGTMGSVGFALAVLSFGQEKLC